MAAPVIAAPARRQASTGLTAVAALLFGVAVVVGLIAILLWSPWTVPGTRSTADAARHYGAGYPLHGGLAGPSRAGQISTIDEWRFGAGYPLHGGLAGPSQVGTLSAVDIAGHYGAGYPLHGGLAGPSRASVIQTVEGNVYGAGYPLHGGLAGPSQVGEGD